MPTKTHYIDGDNYQLRQIIFANTPKAIEQCKSIAQKFKGVTELDTCRNIFNFLKNDIRYQADGVHQKVKLPSALLREKVGDCKSYSLFTGAILTNLGIPWKYVLVSYRQDPTPTHIYVVTDSGIIIDAVWGKFNSEKTPTHKYYHKPIDMRISTITGIGNNAPSKATTTPQTTTTLIGYNTPISNVKTIDSQAPIGAPRAFIWFRTMKGRDASTGEAAEWRTKQVLNAPGREVILQILKANGGGLSTMLYNLIFKTEPTYYPIPESEDKNLTQRIEAFKKSIGFKPVTNEQMDKILAVYKSIYNAKIQQGGAQLATGGSSSKLSPGLPSGFQLTQSQNFEVIQSLLTDSEKEKGYDRIMGSGQWKKAKQVNTYANNETTKLKSKYAVIPSKEASKKYGEFENKWFWWGGDPWDVNDAIQEGAKKSPKGKTFNYLIGVAQSRGLEFKDAGLLMRAVGSVIGGDTFSLDEEGSYVMGKGVGIGEPLTLAAVATYSKLILSILGSLLALLAMFGVKFDGSEEDKKEGEYDDEQAKLEWYLKNGYMYKRDAEEVQAPKPYLEEVTVKGETLVKVDPDWLKKKFGGGTLTAGFGNVVIPLLIGAGALIALNTAGKK